MALTILFAALVVILAVRAMTPPHTPDEAIYHLSVTKQFVQQGRVFPVTDNWAGNMPFLVQMIYGICLIAKADIAAKLFSLILAVICSLALYGFCRRFLTRRAGVVAMFAFFAAGMVVEVAITARVDVSLAGMLFMTAYAMMAYFQSGERGWLYLSAMLAGFSLGIKYSAGIYILLLAVMYLTEGFLRRQPFDYRDKARLDLHGHRRCDFISVVHQEPRMVRQSRLPFYNGRGGGAFRRRAPLL